MEGGRQAEGKGCKQIQKCVLRKKFWARQLQNTWSPKKQPSPFIPVCLCLWHAHRLPSNSVVEKGLLTSSASEENKTFLPFRPRLKFSTPQTWNLSKPECKVITRRSLVLTGKRSPEENKPLLQHQKAELQADSSEQVLLCDFGQILWLLSISRAQVKDYYYITVLWLIS